MARCTTIWAPSVNILPRCCKYFFSGIRIATQSQIFVKQKRTKTMLTGLQPTGIPHLGNYLGVIRPLQRMQSSSDISSLLVTVADLHALTTTGGKKLSAGILELSAALIACLKPMEDCALNRIQPVIFLQSAVPGHTELAWILASCCSLPRLAHLPQWRDKSQSNSLKSYLEESDSLIRDPLDRTSVGLFTYPVLQAADILLYNAHLVPVGADQTAHIELARDLVRIAKNRWPPLKSLLNTPTILTIGVSKIHSLRDPTKKMSKSDSSPDSAILLTDSADTIRAKIRRAQTDSLRGVTYDAVERPGVSNLIRILAAIEDRELETVVIEASGWNKEVLKSRVTDALVRELIPIGTRIAQLKENTNGLLEIEKCLRQGATKAQNIATERLAKIYSIVGCSLSLDKLSEKTDCDQDVPLMTSIR